LSCVLYSMFVTHIQLPCDRFKTFGEHSVVPSASQSSMPCDWNLEGAYTDAGAYPDTLHLLDWFARPWFAEMEWRPEAFLVRAISIAARELSISVCGLEPIGSHALMRGFVPLDGQDRDYVLMTKRGCLRSQQLRFLRAICDTIEGLRSENVVIQSLQLIDARVPVLQASILVRSSAELFFVDLTVDQKCAVEHTIYSKRWLACLSEEDEEKFLIFWRLLKVWHKHRGLPTAKHGGIPSVALQFMAIAVFQEVRACHVDAFPIVNLPFSESRRNETGIPAEVFHGVLKLLKAFFDFFGSGDALSRSIVFTELLEHRVKETYRVLNMSEHASRKHLLDHFEQFGQVVSAAVHGVQGAAETWGSVTMYPNRSFDSEAASYMLDPETGQLRQMELLRLHPQSFCLKDSSGQELVPVLSPALRLLYDSELSRAQQLLASCPTGADDFASWVQQPAAEQLEQLFSERPVDVMTLPWPYYTSALFLEPSGKLVLAQVLSVQPARRWSHIAEFLHRGDDESVIVARPMSSSSVTVEFRPRDFVCHMLTPGDIGERYNIMCQLSTAKGLDAGVRRSADAGTCRQEP